MAPAKYRTLYIADGPRSGGRHALFIKFKVQTGFLGIIHANAPDPVLSLIFP
jgi:hypothetical protein